PPARPPNRSSSRAARFPPPRRSRWWIRVPASKAGLALVLICIVTAIGASVLAPQGSDERFPNLLNAPPTRVRLIDESGVWHAPFIYPWRLANRLEQRYEIDAASRLPLTWFTGGRLVGSSDPA